MNEVTEVDFPIWKKRKMNHIKHIKNASIEAKIVTAADKIHNLYSLNKDLKEIGKEVWNKFNAPREECEWYYREIYNAITDEENEKMPIFIQYKNMLKEMKII